MLTKQIILLALVMLGAYAVHDAEETIKENKLNKNGRTENVRINDQDLQFMKRAFQLRYSSYYPGGALVVRQGQVIGEGSDKTRLLKDPSAHAAVEAVRDAQRKTSHSLLDGCVVYVTVKPCAACISLLAAMGVNKVYYCSSCHMNEQEEGTLEAIPDARSKGTIPQIPIAREEVEKVNASSKRYSAGELYSN